MANETGVAFTAIILAGQRDGKPSKLAADAGVSHKCLMPILGKPLIEYVLDALVATPGLARVRICVEENAVEAVRPFTAGAAARVPVDFVLPEATITESAYVSAEGVEGPVLFTTGDNANLTPDAVAESVRPLGQGYDATIALAPRDKVVAIRRDAEHGYPDISSVSPYRFADGRFSNCNLYGLSSPKVLQLAEMFREGGQFSKYRSRLIRVIGYFNLFLFSLRILTVEQAMKRLSKRLGVRIKGVVLEDGAQAVDVDDLRAYKISQTIQTERRAA